jgi:hypothetical protein
VLRDAARNPSRRQAGGRSVDHVRLAAIILAVTAPREPADVSALALPVQQAAASLGLSENHFRRDVLPHVRSIKVGKVRIVPVVELERWLYLNGRFADEE